MRTTRLERSQLLLGSLDEVFAFFADAGKLEAVTPPWLGFEIRTPLPVVMAAGTILEYRIRWHGLPLPWRTEITVWEPPLRFVDVQRFGPYRQWVHEHRFRTQGGGVVMEDRVDYAALGGRLVEQLMVNRDVNRIFDYRARRLAELFNGEPAAAG